MRAKLNLMRGLCLALLFTGLVLICSAATLPPAEINISQPAARGAGPDTMDVIAGTTKNASSRREGRCLRLRWRDVVGPAVRQPILDFDPGGRPLVDADPPRRHLRCASHQVFLESAGQAGDFAGSWRRHSGRPSDGCQIGLSERGVGHYFLKSEWCGPQCSFGQPCEQWGSDEHIGRRVSYGGDVEVHHVRWAVYCVAEPLWLRRRA